MVDTVAVGEPVDVQHNGKTVQTAIFKAPVEGPVQLRFHNLDGDRQADLTVHGGRDKAVYAYAREHYPGWAEALGRKRLKPAAFGENLTVCGMLENEVFIGNRYRVGTASVIVSQPRLPCFKLGILMADASFPQRFLQSGKLGFYLRVETEGLVEAGDRIDLLESHPERISIESLWRAVFGTEKDAETAARALETLPWLDGGWRRRLRNVVGRH